MDFFRKIKFAVLIVLLPAMLALTGNAIFNLHIHKQSNGTSVVHAHPFQKGDTSNSSTHSHSCGDYILIQHLTSFLFVVITAFVLSCIFAKHLIRIQHESLQSKFGFTASPLNNRPPPAFI